MTITARYNTPPVVLEIDASSGVDLEFDFGPIPMLIVSTFQVNYTVENCGSGISLLRGNYDQLDSWDVLIQRLQSGTPGVAGTFDLSFNGRTIRGIPADVSNTLLDQLLETNFPDEGGTYIFCIRELRLIELRELCIQY